MNGIEPDTPLTQLETILLSNRVEFSKFDDGSMVLPMDSLQWARVSLKYDLALVLEEKGAVRAMVSFYLPLQDLSLSYLAEVLNGWLRGITFDFDSKRSLLNVHFVLRPEFWTIDMYSVVDFCDLLYPLVLHIQREKRWNIQLADLALERLDTIGWA